MLLTKFPNLSTLSSEEQAAIEDDKQRWLMAHNLIQSQSTSQIKAWLNALECDMDREDMRRRLNETAKHKKELNRMVTT